MNNVFPDSGKWAYPEIWLYYHIYISYTTIYYPFNGYVCAHPRAVLKLSHKPILLTNPANIAANPSSWEWRNIHLIWRKEIELFTASSRYNRVWNSQHWHPNASCSSHTPNSQEVGTKIPRPQMWRLEIRNESICLFVLASQGLLSSLCPSNKFIVVDRTLAWSWSWIEATGCRQCVVEVKSESKQRFSSVKNELRECRGINHDEPGTSQGWIESAC